MMGLMVTPMTLYLARHALTLANAEGRILGSGDSPLVAGGQDSARQLAKVLAGKGIEQVVSSPLGRALETAKVFSEILGLGHVVQPDLGELSCGAWEGLGRRRVRPGGGVLRTSWTDRPPGGESYADAAPRVAAALARLGRGPVLAIGHCAVNRVVLALLTDRPADSLLNFVQAHELVLILGPSAELSWIDVRGRSGTDLPADLEGVR